MSRFEFEIHLSEASVAHGDLSRGDIINPLISVLVILYIFFNVVWNSFLATLAANYLQKLFKHIYFKCDNIVVS